VLLFAVRRKRESCWSAGLFAWELAKARTVALERHNKLILILNININAETQIFPFPETRNLIMGNETYDCPHITFVSGLVDYQADTT